MQRPDALDSRTLLLGYGACSIIGGLAIVAYRWPAPATLTPDRIPMASLWSFLLVTMGNAVWLSGLAAAGLAFIEEPTIRRRMLRIFAVTLIVIGLLHWSPAFAIVRSLLPPAAGWIPAVAGFVLLTLSFDPANRRSAITTTLGGATFRDIATPKSLRSRYEEQIRQGARQEERARLARDLHDAVKQQLFAIQTAAATAEARFDADATGARTALTQVRASAREALTEMEVMLEQLQAAPLTLPGLVESLKRVCDATRFRTGAEVTFQPGVLPADLVMPPGAHAAMLRFAQEALANVARHARATHVRVHFGLDQDWMPAGAAGRRFVLSIQDDGQGFLVAAPPRGMGLRNMAARAAEAGGSMDLTSTPGKGTTANLTILNVTDSPRRYAIIAAAALVAIPLLLVVENFAASLFAIVVAIRYGIAAYRIRSWH